ncbi:MAG: aldolase, partial [Nitrososphaerales archaeon]
MYLGKTIRLKRIFAHPSGRFCSVAVDHLLGYGQDMPPGLLHIRPTLAANMDGKPDAVTMHKGIAASLWPPFAGQVPLIIQASGIKTDDTAREVFATPEDAVRLGADGYAVAAFIRGATEGATLRAVSDAVREA